MKTLRELFYQGGPPFMSILTLLFIVMVAWMVYHFLSGYIYQKVSLDKTFRKLKYGKSIGLFSLVIGILGQLIGLFSAFSFVAKEGGVSPQMMFGGLKVSMVPRFMGFLFIFYRGCCGLLPAIFLREN